MVDHIPVVHKNCERSFCPICDGGLFLCSVCGCAEGATTDDCPGKLIDQDDLDLIYDGKLNFRNGEWRKEASSRR